MIGRAADEKYDRPTDHTAYLTGEMTQDPDTGATLYQLSHR